MTVDAVDEPFRTQLTVRLRDGHALLGVDLPRPCAFTSGGDIDILWMGPDEYLVLGPPLSRESGDLEAELSRESGVLAVVDVSAQRNVVRLTGEHARDVLAHGCSIDLEASPPGTCVQTLLARTGIVLMVREEGFTILVRQSFSDYFKAWLADASLEYVS
ncbi:sarcosine oxidase subunit gamma [Amycolatopsis balhimycina DSM 5908]|uniref:Sarcosine oxidase subunit gamma n=1 Tax=Amycolatopsis balhimycina DSM 5908 TaxID=1081091 RepID=A0A428WKN5_AMYBA|nr:sarcosine oxidase subunit gamma family protein [Amycolatopsis balhimycina]RSM43590.1 sarcosine oxidase subunit gamma [Amycolatopsis balhimycina DSM 5908]